MHNGQEDHDTIYADISHCMILQIKKQYLTLAEKLFLQSMEEYKIYKSNGRRDFTGTITNMDEIIR